MAALWDALTISCTAALWDTFTTSCAAALWDAVAKRSSAAHVGRQAVESLIGCFMLRNTFALTALLIHTHGPHSFDFFCFDFLQGRSKQHSCSRLHDLFWGIVKASYPAQCCSDESVNLTVAGFKLQPTARKRSLACDCLRVAVFLSKP